jgi:hypothetical protein
MTLLKIPLLDFVLYAYLESEKIADDVYKCMPELEKYIKTECERF